MHSHIGCAVKTARINGRTLKQALESTQANHRFGNFSSTEWVDVCPKCDAYGLGGEFTHPWPFLCHDGVMRTVADFDADRDEYISGNMEFAGFKFSESALQSAIFICQIEDPAIEPGINIKGLGVSFASKHLRMLDPDRFAVLDEVLSDGLGFALNPKGYKLFMQLLQDFSKQNHIKHSLAELESGLFILVRQQVRSQ